MGNLVQAGCTECNYREDLYLGAGMLYSQLSVIKGLFFDDITRRIDDWLETHELENFTAVNVLAVCDSCGRLNAMPKAVFRSVDGEEAEFRNPCGCGRPYREPGDLPPDGVACPRCGKPVTFNETGWWD